MNRTQWLLPISGKQTVSLYCLISILYAIPTIADVGGPNRRVTTTPGYGSATVTFKRAGSLKVTETNLPNNRRTKPTFYLGISDPIHIDAGAQYESVRVSSTNDATLRMGWSIYMSGPTSGWTQYVGGTNGSQILDPAMGQRTIDFRMSINNTATLSMTGFKSISRSEPTVAGNFAAMRIKRVVGITQGVGEVRRNASYMLKTETSVNQVGSWVDGQGEWTLNSTVWPSNSPDPTYLPQNFQTISGPGSRFIIDMENPWERLPNGEDKPVHHAAPSRLRRETVNVDLRTAAQLRAQQRAASEADPSLLNRLRNYLPF